MRHLGRLLMLLGGGLGVFVVLAIVAHLSAGAPWLVSAALVKLGFIGSCTLMAGGATLVRLAHRRTAQKQLDHGAPD